MVDAELAVGIERQDGRAVSRQLLGNLHGRAALDQSGDVRDTEAVKIRDLAGGIRHAGNHHLMLNSISRDGLSSKAKKEADNRPALTRWPASQTPD